MKLGKDGGGQLILRDVAEGPVVTVIRYRTDETQVTVTIDGDTVSVEAPMCPMTEGRVDMSKEAWKAIVRAAVGMGYGS